MSSQPDETRLKKRIELLETFHKKLQEWRAGKDVRLYLNKNVIAVRSAVIQSGAMQVITIAPPSAIGGMVMQNLDPFRNLFEAPYGMSMISTALTCIEQAIGVYEHMLADPDLIDLYSKEAFDIEGGIERALRPTFRSFPPKREREVQDAVENILNALGVDFGREKEAAPVGPKAFKPDFTVPDLDLAIEIKLAKENHGAAKIQEELSADIAGYGTKWKRLLVVIYDVGVIQDPLQMRRENMKHFGVSVLIIKH